MLWHEGWFFESVHCMGDSLMRLGCVHIVLLGFKFCVYRFRLVRVGTVMR